MAAVKFFKRFAELYKYNYERCKAHGDGVDGFVEAVQEFDALFDDDRADKPVSLLGLLDLVADNVITSERESAAFMFTLSDLLLDANKEA